MKSKLVFLFLLIFIVGTLSSCGLDVPRPEVKSGEFNFSVTYEFNGEIKTVSGVYVCEYEGTDWALDSGYYRDWDGYIKGDKDQKTLKIGTTEDGGVIDIVLSFYPEYFMGDSEWRGVPEPYLTVTHIENDGVSIQNEAAFIQENYGAKIISYEYDAPIENSFSLFNK